MNRQERPANARSPIIVLTIVLVMTWAVLAGLGWLSYGSYQETKTTTARRLRIEELRGSIIHLDEVLTMSARMAAFTGDLQWEERYRGFEPQLDVAINEAMTLAPEAYSGKAAAETDTANIKLVEMENRAFDLVRQGRQDEAETVLFSHEYETQKQIYAQGMTRFAKPKERCLRLAELRGIIVHLDEVLTMSARSAAATGDLQWEERYRHFEPQLDIAIKEAVALAPALHSGQAAAETDAANIKLVEMENRVFDLVRQGRADEAKAVLFSDEYESQKQVYAKGMDAFAAGLADTVSTTLKREQRLSFLQTGAMLLPMPFLIVGWLVVFRAVRNWKTTLARQAEELVEVNQSLDQRVAERTEALQDEVAERKQAEESLASRARQQTEVAKFGQIALSGISVHELFRQAVALISRVLGTKYAEVLEHLPEQGVLFLRAGVGWKEGWVAEKSVPDGAGSQGGYTLLQKKPVIAEDIASETRFKPPALLTEHNAVGGMTVAIPGRERAFGILGVHTDHLQHFSDDDAHFLEAVANVLAGAIERRRAEEQLEQYAVGLEGQKVAMEEIYGAAEVANAALAEKLEEVEAFNRLAVGRELQMVELKEEINGLLAERGKSPKYEIAEAEVTL